MPHIPVMTSNLAYYTGYQQILFKVRILRALHFLAGSIGRWSGRIPAPDIHPFETIIVPSTKSSRNITVNAYRTKAAMAQDVGPVAVHLTWHGSGFVLDAFGESIPFIAYLLSHPLLENYPLVVLDCDYAKAPEYPCPAPTDDVRDVVEYVFARPEQFNLSKVTMGGFSAGATMGLGLSVVLGKEASEGKPLGMRSPTSNTREGSEHPIKAVIAFYPPVEWDVRPDCSPPPGVFAPGVALPKVLAGMSDGAYFFPPGPMTLEENEKRRKELAETPLFTPRWAELRCFPKSVTLISCEYDTLHVETEKLREELKRCEHGIDVNGWLVKGVRHAWDNIAFSPGPGYEERKEAYDLAAKIIAKAGDVVVEE